MRAVPRRAGHQAEGLFAGVKLGPPGLTQAHTLADGRKVSVSRPDRITLPRGRFALSAGLEVIMIHRSSRPPPPFRVACIASFQSRPLLGRDDPRGGEPARHRLAKVKVFGRGNRYGVEPGNEFGYVNCEVEASGGQEIRDLEGDPPPPRGGKGAKAQRRKSLCRSRSFASRSRSMSCAPSPRNSSVTS